MSFWISVKDKVPETASSVLIYSKRNGISEGYYTPLTGKWFQYRWSAKVEVTHWAPKESLPTPEGKNEL